MSLRQKNGRWEYRFLVNGHRVTKLTDLAATEPNRSAAERLEKKHRDSVLKGEQPAKRVASRAFNRAAEEFVEHANVQYQEHPNSAKRIKTSMSVCKSYFGARSIESVRVPDIERFKVNRLTVHKVKPITLRHDLDNLSLFFKWAKRMELAIINPVMEVERPSDKDAVRIHPLTPAEEFMYFERAADYPNLADVARIMLEQGCRPEEVMSLERANFDGERIKITKGKTPSAKRTLKLTDVSKMILVRRVALRSKWLFPSPKVAGQHLTKLNGSHDKVCAKKPELNFVLYDLRHTFATRAAADGMDLAALAALLGHASLRMVVKYVHPQQEHLDASMDRLSAIREMRQAQPGPPPEPNQAQSKPIQTSRSQTKGIQ